MPDYLNTMIQQPTAFIEMVMSGEQVLKYKTKCKVHKEAGRFPIPEQRCDTCPEDSK